MIYLLTRYSDNGDSTQGLLHKMNEEDEALLFSSYTLEDEARDEKVYGETCIPKGIYEIKFRKILTEKTRKYRKNFDWFTWHLELQNVPNFSSIYIHIGNTDDDTLGCILVQDNANNNQVSKGFNSGSTSAFKRFYKEVSDKLDMKEEVFIRIKDLVD